MDHPRHNMLRYRWLLGVSVCLLLCLSACGLLNNDDETTNNGDTALPTRVEAAALPTASPTSDLPPTRDLATATVAPTPVFERPPAATPTPINAIVNITQPQSGAQLPLGSDITASGLARLNPNESLSLVLLTGSGESLLETAG